MNTKNSKSEFIELSADGSIPAKKSQNILDNISLTDFVEFNNETYPIKKNKSMWNEDYFRGELSLIQHKEFSKERCEHIIAVKDYLQDYKVEGFGITDEQHTPAVTETSKLILGNSNKSQETDISLLSKNPDADVSKDILKGYEPKENLQLAIAKKDIRAIQNIIKFDLKNNRLLVEDIIQEVMFVSQNIPEAFLEYEEDKFCLAIDENNGNWNKDYFLLQQSYLNHNFAMERLMHLINVRDYLAEKGVEGFEYIKVQPTPQTQANHTSSNSSEHTNSSSDRSRSNNGQSSQRKQEDGFIKTAMKIGGAVLEHIRALIAKLR
ncbi:hypothetical protein [uncultured Psychrobacter sp.]|uniref:hypothetical protein n=1 Tax=uncultured Psychrobacter sp. TaxID=259303 RepID=UPI0026256AEE|nr:hypothetical protein [uncultured Psychrobacter sp.]